MPAAVSEHCAVTLKGLLVHFLGNKSNSNPQRSSRQGGDHHRGQGEGEEGDEARRQDTKMVTSVTKNHCFTVLLIGTVSTG